MDVIEQGENYPFSFTVSGASGLACDISLVQYPGGPVAFTRTINADASGLIFAGSLTSAETDNLHDVAEAIAGDVWFIHGRLTDTDEDIREPLQFKVKERWVPQ